MYIHDKSPLNEITRWEIIRRSKRESNKRYEKAVKGRIYRAKDFGNVDFENLFSNDSFVWNSRVGDYIVTISFEGPFQNLYDRVRNWSGKNRWKRIDLKLLTKCLSEALDSEDLQVNCSCPDFCLHEDTEIKTLDGNVHTIKELYEMFSNGEDIWVYSTDEKGDFKPGHVSDVWISGYVDELVEITLDNDEVILTTPNHLYMLRCGDYCRADELSIGQSLMPLYFKDSGGYECVMLNSKPKSFVSVYKTVANEVLLDKIEEAKVRSGESIISIHHADFNKRNNHPTNLIPMGHQEHYKYHYTHVLDNPEQFKKFSEAGHEYWRTPEGRKEKSDFMRRMVRDFWDNMTEQERQQYIERTHRWMHTEEGREKLSASKKEYWSNLPDEEKRKRGAKASIIMNGEHGEKASKRTREYWKNLTPEQYEKHCAINREHLKMAKTTERCIEARRKNGNKVAYENVIRNGTEILNYLIENNLEINEENYEKYRKRNYPHFNTIIRYGLLDKINHKVKSIRRIQYDTKIPVYDMTVDKYNNFLVNAGVVLHNCYRFSYWLSRPEIDAKYGQKETRPPKIRNTKNNQGYVCKHILAVLYGKRWVPAAAKAWLDFIRANPELSEELIWG